MPRVHLVKKARKAIKAAGIKKGDSYYWWKFRFGGKRVSKTPPRRSQLTQSEFLSAMYEAEDEFSSGVTAAEDLEDVAAACDAAADQVREAGEGAQERFDNMPEQLQQGDTGQLLEQRAEQCSTLGDELETAGSDIRELDTDETKADKDGTLQEAKDRAGEVSWEYE